MLKKWSEILKSMQVQSSLYESDHFEFKKREQSSYFSDSSTFDFISLIENWPSLVGKLLGENSIPIKIQAPFLVILTKHPIFSQELKNLESQIIFKIIEKYPNLKNKIQKIKYLVNEPFFNIKKDLNVSKIPAKEYHPFDPKFIQAKKEAEKEFNNVEDVELRELFIKIFVHHKMQD